uniref:Uncharacterized protein n=1 Tax=Chromera velia CCMP2878 TaxID=1169474 RepID=A0A0G4GHR6_9ALVE|mmetsp:Transcript_10768/g.20834  ORF Transcript_10768/g.20834 Transcript_10768/m.20834 type:complete len:297 (+) Transcript_10768:141-1031(+)|eukprot:Cvel_21952.t1-p1 / transcript=Cvel_21952.t1 / gene=Cvel_21952 / organism=Chromera_velia_CCMP2878 / gene_product=hypothetical protein / transcript_product=hypothetical protein / location=Cvel_scaffold2108:15493-17199(-) / protein_length=296 / sequence_SO=supercontig / SO=protein_coding / is_pseudo=false
MTLQRLLEVCLLLPIATSFKLQLPFMPSSTQTRAGDASRQTDAERLLGSVSLTDVETGREVSLCSRMKGKGRKTVVAFLTHFGDLSSWEYAQKLSYLRPRLEEGKVDLLCVGIGSREAGLRFSELNGFPVSGLFCDETGSVYRELGFNSGFLGEMSGVNPYVKLFFMLLGIGSPGTIPAVLKGYFGSKEQRADWATVCLRLVDGKRFDVLGERYQRPFEVATVRLQNMMAVLDRWQDLAPSDDNLIIQQGGTLAFDEKGAQLFRYDDKGILVYAEMDALLQALGLPDTSTPVTGSS